jgi:hypothetical protein
MQLTKLRAAPERQDKVPPCAPAGQTDGGTASQLIRSVRRTPKGLSVRARTVLADAGVALDLADQVLDPVQFRIHWVALLALLRAVGHVLKEVDRQQGPPLRQAIDDRWKQWEADRTGNRIFWDFIKDERDLVLKTYDIRYEEDDVTIEESRDGRVIRHLNVPFFSKLLAGSFAGQPALQVARAAVAWWSRELDAIEQCARSQSGA